MKKSMLTGICLVLLKLVSAQVLVNIQLPATGLTVKSQLWNLSVVNTGQEIQAQIEVTLTDASNNQRVFSGTSRSVTLPKGVKQLRIADVMPVNYAVAGTGYGIDASPDGFLPMGVFNVCYTIVKFNNDAAEQVSEDCETIEIEPVSPPLLIMPADSEYVELPRPFFNWLPPTPFNVFNNLLYDWVLVEVQGNQSAADAIQQNIPVLVQQNLPYTSLQYPLSMPQLDSTKLYAWRVSAKNNTSVIANSEVWSFRIQRFTTDTTTYARDGYYARVQREENAAFVICSGVLRFEYIHESNQEEVAIRIYDISKTGRTELQLDAAVLPVRFNQNFMQLDLRSIGGIKNKRMYLLEITDKRNEKWYLKFEYRKPED